VRASYRPEYFVPLPEGHPFPMGKFPAMHRILRSEGLITEEDVHEPRSARWSDLLSVHEPEYLEALDRGDGPYELVAALELLDREA
jgi:acetoin utilization deacetylase AcuC-like enzyme